MELKRIRQSKGKISLGLQKRRRQIVMKRVIRYEISWGNRWTSRKVSS